MIDYLHRSPCICWYHIVVLKVLNSLPIRFVDFFLDKDEVAFSQLVINNDRALEVTWFRNIPSLVLEEVLAPPRQVVKVQDRQLCELHIHQTCTLHWTWFS